MSEALGGSIDARMSDAVEAMDRDFNHIRTGRASTSLVDRLHVDYYGTSMTLNQLANISVPEATTVVIQPWDRNALQPIEKAIMRSDVGITPNVDGIVIRLNIPPLTEERRRDLVKLVHKRMEEAKVEIRGHRRDAVESIKKQEKDGQIGADQAHRELEAVEKATHRWTDEVDRVGKAKEAEVLEV
jgi:ribosome recycling factor